MQLVEDFELVRYFICFSLFTSVDSKRDASVHVINLYETFAIVIVFLEKEEVFPFAYKDSLRWPINFEMQKMYGPIFLHCLINFIKS